MESLEAFRVPTALNAAAAPSSAFADAFEVCRHARAGTGGSRGGGAGAAPRHTPQGWPAQRVPPRAGVVAAKGRGMVVERGVKHRRRARPPIPPPPPHSLSITLSLSRASCRRRCVHHHRHLHGSLPRWWWASPPARQPSLASFPLPRPPPRESAPRRGHQSPESLHLPPPPPPQECRSSPSVLRSGNGRFGWQGRDGGVCSCERKRRRTSPSTFNCRCRVRVGFHTQLQVETPERQTVFDLYST